jgi:endonuclease/exonuclease/phosphatase family metal-dependent hydrolase
MEVIEGQMKLLNWNIEWANKHSRRGKRITEIIATFEPDVICLTEATQGIISTRGYVIEAETDYGYPNDGKRRKVMLWSKEPWQQVDTIGSPDLPGGRFVSGVTFGVRFAGICIPWFDAHVNTGRKDRLRWQDHRVYIQFLKPTVDIYLQHEFPVCITGDFNQRIPRQRQPEDIYDLLQATFAPGYVLRTGGIKDEEGHLLIDHIAISGGLSLEVEKLIPKKQAKGLPLSDHVGVLATLSRT